MRKNRGFSLAELFVVVAVIAAVSALVVPSYRSFDGRVNFDNVFTDVLLAIREAQIYGIGARAAEGGGATEFDTPYGVSFNAANPQGFIFFADINRNNTYDGDFTCASTECARKIQFEEGFSVARLCINDVSDSNIPCDNTRTDTLLRLDVTFQRPSPAPIYKETPPQGAGPGDIYSGEFVIRNRKGEEKNGSISLAGELFMR